MEGDKSSTGPRPTGRPRFGLWQFVSLAAAGGLIAGVGYFSLQVLKNHSFNDDRAFRVLAEIVGQFENLQGTMINVRSLLPATEIDAKCKALPASEPEELSEQEKDVRKKCKDGWYKRDFAQRLDIPGLELVENKPAADPSCIKPVDTFEIQLTAVERPYSVYTCTRPQPKAGDDKAAGTDKDASAVPAAVSAAPNAVASYQFRGNLRAALPTFASQTFFDEAFIAAGTGAVIARIDRGVVASAAGRAQLQVEASGTSLVTDVRQLLQRAAQEAARRPDAARGESKEADKATTETLPSHSVVLQHGIGGDMYRVFVLPFNPAYRTILMIPRQAGSTQDDPPTTASVPSGPLYVVGIKRDAVVGQVKHALWPNGTLGITVVALVAILSWPLLGLRFASPHESISRFSACASIIALILLPMVLTTTAVWAWSRFALERWADTAAEQYARDIEGQLLDELKDNLALLEDYDRKLYSADGGRVRCEAVKTSPDAANACKHSDPLQLLIRPQRLQRSAVMSIDLAETLAKDCCADLLLSAAKQDTSQPEADTAPEAQSDWLQWSSLRTVIALDQNASKSGPRVTAFGDANRLQRRAFDLPNRPYFKALKQGEAWKPRRDTDTPWNYVPERGFVAQRLFNRGDAARVLQVAIPRSCSKDTAFCGVVTGDTRLHALTATVLPPLLRFAVVDRSTGSVLFHSDDNRSLAENLLTESENNADLLTALGSRVTTKTWDRSLPSDHFSGSYLGDPHRFFYRPVLGMPWGIAVFYPKKELGDVSLRASIATIGTALVGVLIVAAAFLLDSILNRGRIRSILIRTLWPQWALRGKYPACHRVGAVIFVLAIAAHLLWLRSPNASLAWAAIGVIGIAYGWLVLKRRRDVDTLHGYTSHYLKCMLVALCLISVLPSLWLGLSFHDASAYSFLKSGLVQAGESLERRHALIANDLRRWSTAESAWNQPDAWFLTRELPVPGYIVSQRDPQRFSLTATLFDTMPWANRREPPSLGSIRCLIWQEVAQSSVQSRWRGRRPREHDSADGESLNKEGRESGENRTRSTSTNPCDWRTNEVRYSLSSDDGQRMTLRIPYRPADSVKAANLAVGSDTFDAFRLLTLTIIAVTIFMLMWLLATLVATRLLGISIPFFARYIPVDAEARWTAAKDEVLQNELAELRKAHPGEFSDKDEQDYVAVRTANTYKRLWEHLSSEEQLLLHELAKGELANPADRSVIERLLRQGLLTPDPWPRITDEALGRYAAASERAGELAEWQHEAVRSTWTSIRTPLLLLLLVVVAALMWLAGSTMQLLSTVLAGTAALFGHFMQAANLLRGSQKS